MAVHCSWRWLARRGYVYYHARLRLRCFARSLALAFAFSFRLRSRVRPDRATLPPKVADGGGERVGFEVTPWATKVLPESLSIPSGFPRDFCRLFGKSGVQWCDVCTSRIAIQLLVSMRGRNVVIAGASSIPGDCCVS